MERDTHAQTGEPLHVDLTTVLLLALGADPRRGSGGAGGTAKRLAFVNGHSPRVVRLASVELRANPERAAVMEPASADRPAGNARRKKSGP